MTPTHRPQRHHKSNHFQLQKQTKTTLTLPAMSLCPHPLTFGRKQHQHILTIKNDYSEVAHWKPQFVTLSKNKAGHCSIESLSFIFNEVAEELRNSNVAFYYAMVMPHLVLACTKNRETSTGKTIQRRMEAWLSCEFNEAKALQLRIPKVWKTQKPDAMKSFDIQMSSGKISNALRCLDGSQKGNVLSLQEKVGKTVMQILQEKHPKPMT